MGKVNEERRAWSVREQTGSEHWRSWVFTYGDRLALLLRTAQPLGINPVKIHLSPVCHPAKGLSLASPFLPCRACGCKTSYPAGTRRWVDPGEDEALASWARVTMDPLEATMALEDFKGLVEVVLSRAENHPRSWESLNRPELLA